MINNDPAIENAAEYLKHPYANIKANAYDMVLNGNEIGGGSIRIFQRELQEKMFAALGMTKEESLHKFSFLLGAFEYGAHHMVVSHSASTTLRYPRRQRKHS
jgi:aspartyl-tRNA synthetase